MFALSLSYGKNEKHLPVRISDLTISCVFSMARQPGSNSNPTFSITLTMKLFIPSSFLLPNALLRQRIFNSGIQMIVVRIFPFLQCYQPPYKHSIKHIEHTDHDLLLSLTLKTKSTCEGALNYTSQCQNCFYESSTNLNLLLMSKIV